MKWQLAIRLLLETIGVCVLIFLGLLFVVVVAASIVPDRKDW